MKKDPEDEEDEEKPSEKLVDMYFFALKTSYVHYLAYVGDVVRLHDYLAVFKGYFFSDRGGLSPIEVAIKRRNYEVFNYYSNL